MNLFFQENIDNQTIVSLSQEESFHCSKVLRLNINDEISITDGKGFLYKAKILNNNQKKSSVEIIDKQFFETQKDYKLHIAIAPTKNIDRFIWFVEKAVEIGVDKITPIISRFSERKIIKPEKIEKKIIAAMKQSLKYHKPILEPVIGFDKFVATANNEQKLIAYCKAGSTFANISLNKDLLFLVGPEGGIADFELELALKNKFIPLKINDFRLRTETAGVLIASAVNVKFQK
jgi:16S rRNA (uracil1498-N3)-methyltransferase